MSTIQTDAYQNLLGQDWFSSLNSSTTGYQKLPGGLILMYCRSTGSWDGEGERTVVLPIAVQNIVACMIGTSNVGATSRDSQFQLRNFYGYGFSQIDGTKPGFKTDVIVFQNAMNSAGGGQNVHLFLVGY